jgi:predicted component of type VI protein secretion system
MKGQSKTDLYFGITAKLKIDTEQDEAVNFDALLQPTTLQYSVSKKRATQGVR